ncbi:MAG TPA: TrkA C-terminal domain-containing protein, partial [Acidobacteriota bacterium]|nr:TrkA C-terminal domain-containing protein [Acidobacteriota bacterium]
NKRGLRINLATVTILAAGGALTALLARLFGFSAATAAGLFCGSFTNTPALAATVETVKGLSANLPAAVQAANASSPVVAYSLAYPFGVLGVILWFLLFSKIFKADLRHQPPEGGEGKGAGAIFSRTYQVTNPAVFGKTLGEALSLVPRRTFSLSRIMKADRVDVVRPDAVLARGDLVVAVGTSAALDQALVLFGEVSPRNLAEEIGVITSRRLFVSSREAVGKTIRDLRLEERFNATITRLRRGDVEFVPTPGMVLEVGDRIRVVAFRERLGEVTRFFGDSLQSIAETDFLSLSLGIVLGVFVGLIPIPLPGGLRFKLGFAGGPLIVALILGRLQRTGPVRWVIPTSANLVLRQTGLVFFLAGIGSRAGYNFITTMRGGGLTILAAGALVTSAATAAALLLAVKCFKLPMPAAMGMMSGLQTQPACLAYANQQSGGDQPNIWYATVYPAAMVMKILLAQVIVSVLFRG